MKINFIYAPDVSLEEMIGYEIASIMWGQLFSDDIEVNILAKTTDQLDSNVIGGATPIFHEQHYALFLQYYEADITSEEDQIAFDALQQGNTVDFLLNGDLVGGNTKLKLTTALAKALGMTEAISLERYLLDESEHFIDGTIMMNQGFTWDFNYLRNSEAAADTLDFMSVALHETGHILGFTSSLDFLLKEETLYSGRTELSNFSPLDLFRFSAESLAQDNPDGTVSDLSIGGVAWFSPDGGETLSAKMSTGKDGDDGYQASHWERRYDPLGIMDPTLWYQERATITDLDVLAFDLMGYDLSSTAADVEQLFESQNLEAILAQAKIQLANKLGYDLQYIEDNADVPVSSLDLIAEIEAAMLEAAQETTTDTSTSETSTETTTDTTTNEGSNSGDVTEPQNEFTQDLSTMIQNAFNWWWQGNGGGNGSWAELYEWWWQGNGGGNGSWQELYEWWWQGNGGGNGSWAELYEWWWQGNGGGNGSWAELHEWWQEDSEGTNSWWQEAFFASQDNGNLDNVELPGENNDITVGPTYYQEFQGGNEDDIIGGDPSNDDISAGAGEDLIDGAGGDDTIFGGGGFDTIFGFDGYDSIMGGDGDDVISGESDNDVLLGEAGADVLMGGDHDDYLDGGTGSDFLSGDTGHDALIGGAGDDALEGEAGKDLLVGGAGEDIGNGGSGDDFIFGDEYSESLKQAFGNNLNNLTNNFTPAVDTDTTEASGGDNTNTNNTYNVVLAQDPFRVEAESLSWTGNYKIVNKSFASDGSLIRNNVNNQSISGTTTFTGQTGVYNIIIGYHDIEIDDGEIKFKLNGNIIDTWQLTKDLEDHTLKAENFTTHIISNVSLTTNESFTLESIVSEDDYGEGSLDYIEFVPVADNTPSNDLALGQDPIVIEAENMTLSGGYYPDNDDYNGTVVRTSSGNPSGVVSSPFTGDTGYYQVVVRYIDEHDGQASLSVKIADTEIDNWVLNQNTSGSNQYFSRTISEGTYIDANAMIEIQGQAEGSEFARVDYIEFIPVEPPQAATVELSPTKIEAEDMTLSGGYYPDDNSYSGSVIRTGSSNTNGVASQAFTGDTGYYQVVLRYVDESDGQASLSVKIADTEIDNWVLNQNTSGSNQYFSRTISEGMYIDANAMIEIQGQAENYEFARVDYIEFIPVEPPQAATVELSPTKIEAENMTLSGGYYPDDNSYSGSVIRTGSSNTNGVASQEFTGDTGYYQVVVRYVDESDGQASLSVKIAGSEIDNWVLNQNTSGSNQYYSRTISEGMYIDANAMIEIQGQAEGSEFARVDYIEFIPVEPPATSEPNDTPPEPLSVTPELVLGLNSDILRGGAGNDGIDGGEGNDIIFGEDELNDSSNITSPGITGAFHYGHSSYILTPTALTWEEAQTLAESYGGNLVTINDAAEEAWLEQTFGNSEFWIGLTDKENEGTFKWASGEAVTYNNWRPNEPNNGNGAGSDYVRMNMDSIDVRWGDHLDDKQLPGIIEITWSSVGGNDTIIGGTGGDQVYGNSGNDLIYGDHHSDTNNPPIPQGAITHNGSAYLLTDSTMTWDEAQAQAQSLGGNLVTINDAAENQWLKDTFGTTEALWIGLSDAETEGTWKWASGEVPDWVLGADNTGIYADWAHNQPDNWGENEDYAVLSDLWNPNSDKWSDVYTDSWFQGIIEIKLTVGNSASSGNDNIFGNGGHDIIRGGAGDDVINGTDGIVAGYLERDILEGGTDADKFILGDETQAFYATGAAQDYAVIQDFNPSEDVIQLSGVAGDYQQVQQGNDLHLARNGDLVAILENNNTLNLNGSAFAYVSTV